MTFRPVSLLVAWVGWLVISLASSFAGEPRTEGGTARFVALNQEKCPPQFRLDDHEFDYQIHWREIDATRFDLADVTFPSPVKTPHERNNTVHCELYRSKQAGKRPAVIVLHI